MQLFVLFSALITLAAVFSYINIRFIKLPSGISLMVMGVLVSVGLVSTGMLSTRFTDAIKESLSTLNFSEFILGILLSFLLFAGSLHVQLNEIKSLARSIFSFATIGTVISTLLIATAIFYVVPWFGLELSFISCLLFGALISPTDPIAVMGILAKEKLSRQIEVRIVGESLFNDGVGVVIFVALLGISATGIESVSLLSVVSLFLRETVGGLLVGLAIGFTGFRMMKAIDDFPAEILISLAMVMGGYTFCSFLHVSGPLAMVIAGMFTGNKGKREAMSSMTMDYLGKFWEVVDHILNALLFMLIGLEIVVVKFQSEYVWIGIVAAASLVLSRYISLWCTAYLFGIRKKLEKNTLEIMTWGGLRGGISIALALSLPVSNEKAVLVAITFVVVLFSILVQGLSIGRLIKYLGRRNAAISE